MQSRKSQQGMTMIGWILVLGMLALLLNGAFRLVPVYLNAQNLSGIMSAVVENAESTSQSDVRRAVARQFRVESVDVVDREDFEVVQEDGESYLVLEYEHRVAYLGNIDLVVSFDKRERFPSS